MRGSRVRLEDMAEAIDGIERVLAGVDLPTFSSS
jgi:hypothetical protein